MKVCNLDRFFFKSFMIHLILLIGLISLLGFFIIYSKLKTNFHREEKIISQWQRSVTTRIDSSDSYKTNVKAESSVCKCRIQH